MCTVNLALTALKSWIARATSPWEWDRKALATIASLQPVTSRKRSVRLTCHWGGGGGGVLGGEGGSDCAGALCTIKSGSDAHSIQLCITHRKVALLERSGNAQFALILFLIVRGVGDGRIGGGHIGNCNIYDQAPGLLVSDKAGTLRPRPEMVMHTVEARSISSAFSSSAVSSSE